MIRQRVWIWFLAVLLPVAVRGESAREAAILRGVAYSLNEEFDRANVLFDSLMAAEPNRPEGAFYKGVVVWRKSLMMEDGFRLDSEVKGFLERAMDLAEAHIDAHGESAEMYLWLGNAHGLQGAVHMRRKEILDGILAGLAGRDYLFEALRLDPLLEDVRFGLGLSDYILSQKPALLRMVSRLLSLPSGDREGGLAQLERVVREGTYSRMDALSARAYIELYYEHNHAEARVRFEDLIGRFPNALDYRIRHLNTLLALTLEQGQDHRHALLDSTRSIREMSGNLDYPLHSWLRTKPIFIESVGYYLLGEHRRAQTGFSKYIQEAHPESWLRGFAELTLGKLADLRGDRQAAVAHYRQALEEEDIWGAHDEARGYLKRAFDGAEPGRCPPDLVERLPEHP